MTEDNFASFNKGLLDSGDYSDMTISCGSRTWKVHRSILCPQSSFFRAACSNGFLESLTMKINLVEDDPDAVDRMLQYLYTHDYPGGSDLADLQINSWEDQTNLRCDQLVVDIMMYIMADKYDISPLKVIATDRFKAGVGKLQGLPPNFPSVYRAVCSLPSESGKELRELVAQKCAKNMQQILKSKDQETEGDGGVEAHETWPEVLEDDGEMTFRLLECYSNLEEKEKSRLKGESSKLLKKLHNVQDQYGWGR